MVGKEAGHSIGNTSTSCRLFLVNITVRALSPLWIKIHSFDSLLWFAQDRDSRCSSSPIKMLSALIISKNLDSEYTSLRSRPDHQQTSTNAFISKINAWVVVYNARYMHFHWNHLWKTFSVLTIILAMFLLHQNSLYVWGFGQDHVAILFITVKDIFRCSNLSTKAKLKSLKSPETLQNVLLHFFVLCSANHIDFVEQTILGSFPIKLFHWYFEKQAENFKQSLLRVKYLLKFLSCYNTHHSNSK